MGGMPERVIGVDVGGTKVAVATLRGGALEDKRLHPTNLDSPEALIDQIVEAIHELAGEEGFCAVGVGLPSVIEWETGRVRSSVNIPLGDVPLRQVLRDRLEVPVFVDNDANVAALSEAHDEDGTLDIRHLVMFTVGTGVGGGVIIDGRVFRGATGAAPELGHWIIGADLSSGTPEHRDKAPQPGSLEALAAGKALDALGEERGLGKGPEVVEAAKNGEPAAVEALALLGHRLGIGIANAINAFDPEVVAIGGGVSTAGRLLLEPATETALRFVLPGVGTRTEIRLARSGPEAGVRGAALLARQELALESGDTKTTTDIGDPA
jgi:glucokinase